MFAKFKYSSFIFFFILGILNLVFNGVIFYTDTISYTQNHIMRSGGYPCFFDLFNANSYVVAIVQIMLYAFSYNYLILKLDFFSFKYLRLGIVLFLIIPLFSYSNAIITEGLTIPLFVLFFAKSIQLAKGNFNKIDIILLFLLFLFLLFVRSQFVFLIPGMIFMIFTLNMKSFWKKTILTMSVFSVFLLSIIFDKVYHKFEHKEFIATQYFGLQFLPALLISSDYNDTNCLNRSEKLIFIKIRKELYAKGIIENNVSLNKIFKEKYNEICHSTIKPIFLEKYNSKNEVLNYRLMENESTSMSMKLFKNNIVRAIVFWFNNFRMTGYNNLIFLFFILFAISVTLVNYYFYKTYLSVLWLTSYILLLSNQCLVSITGPVDYRYVIYNYIAISILIIMQLVDYYKKFELTGSKEKL